ncbi:MAG: protein translocase subunit SecD [Desulfobulbaceae bacterium]|nr:protein translocase subunit SecD [Desulfobulbaceae bacterium]
MNRSLAWKTVLLLVLVLFSGITLLPSFYKNTPDWWGKYLAPEGLRLGLDLQGGMHLVLKVDLDKAIENTLDFAANDLKDALSEKKITVVRTPSTDTNTVIFTLPNTAAVGTVNEVIAGDFPDLSVDVQSSEGTFPRIILKLKSEKIDFINQHAVDQSLEIIRNRIDQFGVAEPVIVRQGKDEIVVQLPGVKEPERALTLIGQTAQLEFKMVDDQTGIDLRGLIAQAVANGQWREGDSRRQLNLALQHSLPPETQIYFEKEVNPETGIETKTPLLIRNQVLMTGEMVKDAQVRVGGNFNEPYVSVDLTGRGGRVFGQITEKSVGKRMAIVLDEVVRSAPVIREKIMGGKAQISGSFTYEEATDLAIVLRVGALPAPVSIIQNLTVGASLGQDSINRGLMSGLVGTAMVVLFMIIYYRLSGIIANFGMVINILFLFTGLAAMQATLTLPGIAGIILSIGMAVDSNILIFERMREEFALGKTVKSGIEGGYDKAFSTIIDAHVTTLITALALFLFGTGPIKGFAVTLSLGIIFNLFSTLFGTRLCYDILHDRKWLKPLRFGQFIGKTNINFMGIRKFTFAFSSVISIIGVIAFVQILRGDANLGVDFSGGTFLQYQASKSFSLGEVRQVLAKGGIAGVDLQEVEGENRLIVKMKKSTEVVGNVTDQLTKTLNQQLPGTGFTLESQSEIGSSVSADLRDKAIQAIVISMLGVILYLAFRFDLRYGIAAAAATFHDVLAVIGVCWLFDIEINLLIVTALLTIAGYSLNDTVVAYDRIRENVKKLGEKSGLHEIINLSVNEVLSRSLATSLTTFLSVLALYFLGGAVIHEFSFALLFGIGFGAYSSVFVASPLLDVIPKRGQA